MSNVMKVITKTDRYLYEIEANFIRHTLNDYNYSHKLHKISNNAYMVELPNIDNNDRKKFLKEELKKIDLNIYKTSKSLEELREIQRNKELNLQ